MLKIHSKSEKNAFFTKKIDGKPIIDLPERTVITIKVKFTKYERNRYKNLKKISY